MNVKFVFRLSCSYFKILNETGVVQQCTIPGASGCIKKVNTFKAKLTQVGLFILIQEGGAEDWNLLHLTSPAAVRHSTGGWTAVA